jgi:hypothetical protein
MTQESLQGDVVAAMYDLLETNSTLKTFQFAPEKLETQDFLRFCDATLRSTRVTNLHLLPIGSLDEEKAIGLNTLLKNTECIASVTVYAQSMAIGSFSDGLACNKTVTELFIHSLELTRQDIANLASALSQNVTLRRLSLAALNQIESAAAVFDALAVHPAIETLELYPSFSGIYDACQNSSVTMLRQSRSMRILRMYNWYGAQRHTRAQTLIDGIKDSASITTLDLRQYSEYLSESDLALLRSFEETRPGLILLKE